MQVGVARIVDYPVLLVRVVDKTAVLLRRIHLRPVPFADILKIPSVRVLGKLLLIVKKGEGVVFFKQFRSRIFCKIKGFVMIH